MVTSATTGKKHFTIATPWYHGWNIIAVTILFQAVTLGLMLYSYSFWIAPFRTEFGASTGTVLLAASLAHLGMGVYSPFAGRIIDAHALRLLTTVGIVTFGFGYFLVSLASDLWQIMVIYATLLPIGAIFAGALAAQVATTRWFEKKRGAALGISAIGTSLGGFVFPPIVTALNQSMGWRESHVILAVALVAIMVPIIWIVVRDRGSDDIEPGAAMGDDTLATKARTAPKWTTLQLVKNKKLWILVASVVPLMTVFISIQFNIAPISEAANIPAQQAAFLMSAVAVSMIIGKLLFGAMADKMQHRVLFWISAAALLVSLSMLQFADSYLPMMLGFALMGLSAGGIMPLMGAVIASRFGTNNFGRVSGLIGPVLTAAAFAPVLVGYLKANFESYDPIFQILMLLLVPSVAAAYFLGPAVAEVPPSSSP